LTTPLWPAANAALNLASLTCLVLGYLSIKRGQRETHKRFMLAAFSCSVIFLASYLAYHFQVGSVRFGGSGAVRVLYFAILLSHTTLAVLTAPLVVATLHRGLTGRFEPHRRIARFTLPIWMYVSATGVVVYLMLYQM
jgi:putative membrane protein